MSPPARPSWDAYYLTIARAVATRADCTRRRVGAIVVQGDRIVSTGYNGAPPGKPGCLSAGACPRGRLTAEQLAPGSSYDTGVGACIAVHAEANALLRAAWADLNGATLYVTAQPCDGCARLIEGARIGRVVFPRSSRAPRSDAERLAEIVAAGGRAERCRHEYGPFDSCPICD